MEEEEVEYEEIEEEVEYEEVEDDNDDDDEEEEDKEDEKIEGVREVDANHESKMVDDDPKDENKKEKHALFLMELKFMLGGSPLMYLLKISNDCLNLLEKLWK
nr:glutamic acid-rich protein-like [Setaria viridis]